jgi:hypothetical protein
MARPVRTMTTFCSQSEIFFLETMTSLLSYVLRSSIDLYVSGHNNMVDRAIYGDNDG